tara:strand:- start:1035 stop:1484 length:450 start_codon:yes stop_codon:yes gene_type:complete
MVKYEATIQSKHNLADVFEYLSNFCSVTQWDPGVIEANQVVGSSAEIGSSYEVIAKFGASKVPLRYEIVKLVPSREIELMALAPNFIARDVMKFRENNGGTVVQYQAELKFSGFWRLLSPLMQLIFNRVGDKAAAGLEKCLNVRELVKI